MKYVSDQHEYLGTQIFVEIGDQSEQKAKNILTTIFTEANRIEQKFSRFLDRSALSQANHTLEKWQTIDDEFMSLLKAAKQLQDQTDVFDISIKSVLDSWGYDENYSLMPKDKPGSIGAFELNEDKKQVRLTAEIDFGGLGKGYFLDQAVYILQNHSIENALINAGGDVYAVGQDSEANPYKILLENPFKINQVLGETILNDTFAGSSAPTKRKWRDKHHLVDPIGKEPADKSLIVYTQNKTSGLLADGWSTALFVLGFEEAKSLLIEQNYPVEAFLIAPDERWWMTPKFKGTLYTK